MRARNREVNIFNMSLLDILTGMLGAFLFLMLGLVPYYTRAKNTPNPNQTPHVDTLLNVVGQWNTRGNMSIYLYDADTGWSGKNTKNPALPRGIKIDNGACNGDTGWGNAANYAHADRRYLVVYSVDGPPSPELYRTNQLSIELLAAQSALDGSGIKGFVPLIACTTFDASGARPNVLYGLYWIKVTKDESKADYVQQYNFHFDPATSDFPGGVHSPPPPAPASAAPAVSYQVQQNVQTQQPDQTPSPSPSPNSSSPESPPAPEKSHYSLWNPFSWFSHSK